MTNNLLSITDLSKQDMLDLIEFSNNFIDDQGNFRKEDLFPDKIVANVFCEPSTRTKSSFAIAASITMGDIEIKVIVYLISKILLGGGFSPI